MMGFGRFASAAKLIAGIEAMHMIREGQLGCHRGLVVSDADRFYRRSLISSSRAPRPPQRRYRDTTRFDKLNANGAVAAPAL